jgi:hypothetical protein
VWSSHDAQAWLTSYERANRDLHEAGSAADPGPLFRHLLSVNTSGVNGTLFSVNGTNETAQEAPAAPVPLFPPDLFTPEQLRQVKPREGVGTHPTKQSRVARFLLVLHTETGKNITKLS